MFDPLLIVTGDPVAGHRYAREHDLGPHQYVVVHGATQMIGRTTGRYVVLDHDTFVQLRGFFQAPAFREEPVSV